MYNIFPSEKVDEDPYTLLRNTYLIRFTSIKLLKEANQVRTACRQGK